MTRTAFALLALLPLAAAACGGGGGGTAGKSGVAGASVTQVTVKESEFRLALSTRRLHPGTYRFTAENAGKIPHALEIDGPGVSDRRTPGTIAPGKSASLTVTLKRGSYEIYCPVPGHKAMGMDLHVAVGGAAAAAPAKTSSGGGGWG